MPDFPRRDLTGIVVKVWCNRTSDCTAETPCADCREILGDLAPNRDAAKNPDGAKAEPAPAYTQDEPGDCWATRPGQRETHDRRACEHYLPHAPDPDAGIACTCCDVRSYPRPQRDAECPNCGHLKAAHAGMPDETARERR